MLRVNGPCGFTGTIVVDDECILPARERGLVELVAVLLPLDLPGLVRHAILRVQP